MQAHVVKLVHLSFMCCASPASSIAVSTEQAYRSLRVIQRPLRDNLRTYNYVVARDVQFAGGISPAKEGKVDLDFLGFEGNSRGTTS